MLGLPPQTPLPNSEQLACPELHAGAHQRNLAFEMPGNRNGASDRGGDKHCDDFSRALGWRGCFFKQLTVHDELQQDIEKEIGVGNREPTSFGSSEKGVFLAPGLNKGFF